MASAAALARRARIPRSAALSGARGWLIVGAWSLLLALGALHVQHGRLQDPAERRRLLFALLLRGRNAAVCFHCL